MINYLTISEICKGTNISNSSCRRYLSEFDEFFSVKGGSRVKKYEEQAVNVIRRIKHLYDEGKDKDEIYNVLINEFPLVVNDDEQRNIDSVPGLATSEDIAMIKESLEEQKKFNADLLKRLDRQQEYIDQSMKKRDQELILTMQESLEAKKQIATAAEKEPEKQGFFSRLFNKSGNTD